MKPSDFIGNVARFWAKVERSNDCWTWTGELNNQGYGRFTLWHDGRRSRIFAHRLSLILHGADLRADQVVMHHCDNPPCVNPDHLTVGTQLDNMRDCLSKGRMNLSGLPIGWAWSSTKNKEEVA